MDNLLIFNIQNLLSPGKFYGYLTAGPSKTSTPSPTLAELNTVQPPFLNDGSHAYPSPHPPPPPVPLPLMLFFLSSIHSKVTSGVKTQAMW